MNKLKFIGTGGCFSTKNINNSAYIKQDGNFILFDCGETVFHEIIKRNIITDDIKNVDIIITHFHSDHVGSLPSLLFFLRFKKIKNVSVIFPIKEIVYTFLDVSGIDRSLYHAKKPNELEYYLKEYEQIHGDVINNNLVPMTCYGYHLIYNDFNLFFSGDTCIINDDVVLLFKAGKINFLYHEVTMDGYIAHVQFEDMKKMFEKKYRKRIYLMHMNDNVDLNKIKESGFRSVR